MIIGGLGYNYFCLDEGNLRVAMPRRDRKEVRIGPSTRARNREKTSSIYVDKKIKENTRLSQQFSSTLNSFKRENKEKTKYL